MGQLEMKATNPTQISLRAAQVLKLAGLVLILVSAIDYIMLPIPLQLGEVDWRVRMTTEFVERGIVPLLGMGLVFAGYAFENIVGVASPPRKPWSDLKAWIFLISTIFSIVFLLLVPLHIANVFAARSQTFARIERESIQTEEQLESRLQQQQNQINALLSNDPNLNDFVSRDGLSAEQLARLEEFREDPEALEEQIERIRENLKKEIAKRKQEAESSATLAALKSSVRIGANSLLLASCYIAIAWGGLKKKKRVQRPRG